MRKSGLLLHITSLASKYGIGDFGPEAYRFADFLGRSKQRCWQVLPVNPPDIRTNPPATYSPYDSLSAFAGNSSLISPELLYQQGLLMKSEIQNHPAFAETRVEYTKVISYKTKLLNAAYERFRNLIVSNKTRVIASGAKQSQTLETGRLLRRPDKSGLLAMTRDRYERFCFENRSWLEDYATFVALREHFWPKLWCDWPVELRERWEKPIKAVKMKLRDSIERQKFLQYIFFTQWFDLKRYCNRSGIEIIGDIPIYVSYSSADVWSRTEIFKLNRYRDPEFVSGVPPDLFSRTGQLWGNPVYNWLALKKTGYRWWLERIKHNLALFDRVRLDHFRGFFRYWRVPAGDKTAKNGKWMKGAGRDFFNVVFKRFPKSSIIAEDLGHITPDVKSFVKKSGLAGMRVIQFGFGSRHAGTATNPHLPHNHVRNSICYTGTHDNNTAVGWFKEANAEQKKRLFDYLSSLSLRGAQRRSNLDFGHKPKAKDINWDFIRLAMNSPADLAIIPVQDILGLGSEARMNHPAASKGNWQWRLKPGLLTPQIAKKLATLTETFGR
jgi:4-alpha-glucanotransferase